MKDLLLELRINIFYRLMCLFDRARRYACQRMTAAINSRSKQQVSRMERKRGLA